MCHRYAPCSIALLFLLSAPQSTLAIEPLGQVAAIAGSPTAAGAEGAIRALLCGQGVFAGDRITTDAASRVGVFMGDVLAYVGESSSVDVGDDGTLHLGAGKLRMIDPSDGEVARQVAALDAAAEVRGNDAEFYIFAEKTGRYAMLCEWDEPLEVSRGAEEKVAAPGECVVAKSKEPLYTAKSHDERLGKLADDRCRFGPVPPQNLAQRIPQIDLASAPEVFDPIAPAGPGPPVIDPCDNPGSGCGGLASSPVADIVIEPAPDTGGFPGSQ